MKIKLFVACEIQYFELGIFSFYLYVYYLTRGFTASTRTFNPPTRAFNLAAHAFNLAIRDFSLLTLVIRLLCFHQNPCFSFSRIAVKWSARHLTSKQPLKYKHTLRCEWNFLKIWNLNVSANSWMLVLSYLCHLKI